MEYPFKVKVLSEEETIELASKFAGELREGDIVELNGNLGAGKTFFIKHAVKNFGINNANSPTFALVNEYYGKLKVYHFDFYRINKAAELYDIGLNDYFNDGESITFIEWGNLFPEVLPKKRIEISITLNEDFSREFYFNKHE